MLNQIFGGWLNKYKGIGVGFNLTKYGNAIGPDGISNAQTTGTINVYINDFSVRVENDFFVSDEDRWRSGAVEFTYKNVGIGFQVYNNYRKEGDRTILAEDGHPQWVNGQTYSSPGYFVFRYGNTVERVGYNHPQVQNTMQNKMIHKKGFLWGLFGFGKANYFSDYNNFKSKGIYGYSGWYNPFSLYGK